MGALHHMVWSFAEVARHGGRVYLGRVIAARDGGATVELEVREQWPPAPAPPPRRWWQRRVAAPAGPEVRTFQLTPPVAWTDPHVSPVQLGMPGDLRRLDAGRDAVIVHDLFTVAMEASAETLDSIRIAFEPAARDAYAGRPVEALTRDLADPSRRDLARAALLARGGIDGALLLDLHPPGQLRGLLDLVTGALDDAGRDRLAEDAARWATASPAARRDARFVTLVERLLAPAALDRPAGAAALGRLCAELDPAQRDERSALYRVQRLLCDRARAGRPLVDGWEVPLLRVLEVVDLVERDLGEVRDALDALPADARARVAAELRALADGPRRKLLGGERCRWFRALAGVTR